jgi:hypothetical protein
VRIGIVGSGISGLCVATELQRQGHEVEVLESAEQFGGRASVADGVEHCTRIMMDDYSRLGEILERIPSSDPAASIWQTLVPVRRMVYLERKGWLSLGNVYALRGAGLSARDRIELMRTRRRYPLLAREMRTDPLTGLRMVAQMSPASWLRIAAASLLVRGAQAFPGPTDAYLIDPWVDHLRSRGVTLRAETRVERVRTSKDGSELCHSGEWHHYDAVAVAAFVPDTIKLLRASGIPYCLRVSNLGMVSCASATFLVDEGEPIVRRHEQSLDEVFLYSGGGFLALYQPRLRRVVCASTRPGPDGVSLLLATRRLLRLQLPIDPIGSRDNADPASRIFAATPLRPDRITATAAVHLAGAYLSRRYPLDSGEAAARSAQLATKAMLRRAT